MPESQELLREAFARHLIVTEKSLGEIFPDIQKGAEMLLEVIKINKKIMVCGNGGSAADAAHFAGSEWLGKYHDDRRPLPAIALADEGIALGNIFRQRRIHLWWTRRDEEFVAKQMVL